MSDRVALDHRLDLGHRRCHRRVAWRATATRSRCIRAAPPMSASAWRSNCAGASYHQADLADEHGDTRSGRRGLEAARPARRAGQQCRPVDPHPACRPQGGDAGGLAAHARRQPDRALRADQPRPSRRCASRPRLAGRPRSSTSAPMPACGPRAPRSPMRRPRRACITSRACWRWRWGRPSASIAWRRAWSRRRWAANWPEATELWNTRSAMRRPAKPEDIADLVAALVANDYVTGEIVIADGGLNLT